MEVDFIQDAQIACELLNLTEEELCRLADITQQSFINWKVDPQSARRSSVDKLYDAIFKKGVRLNRIKEQLAKENVSTSNLKVLFHGSKSQIEEPIDLSHSRSTNDFGRGFYCGETFEQATMFVSPYENPSVYIVRSNTKGLKECRYSIDRDWMLAIAYFRGRLGEIGELLKDKQCIRRAEQADYIVAPIADNRMYQVIDDFLNGEITDIQCQHCLSATNLGMQYIFRTEKALESLEILERCYLSPLEKNFYLESKHEETQIGIDKSKIARREHRGKGLYIDQIMEGQDANAVA